MQCRDSLASTLALALSAGEFEVEGLVERGSRVLGRRWRWLRPLANRLAERYAGQTHPRHSAVTRFLLDDRGFSRACGKHDLRVADVVSVAPTMCPVDAARSWEIPPIQTAGALADWLGLGVAELAWFADLRAFEAKRAHGRLRHYHYRTLAKHKGNLRLIEAPKPRLKAIQRRILHEILAKMPQHAAVHGFRRGRSIKTFASPHSGRSIVAKVDLRDFFPTISKTRVQAMFRMAGYPDEVADLLAGLCTNTTPADAWGDATLAVESRPPRARWLYAQPHLPQGAPTSPALANLCAYRLDCRLAGLAHAVGADYTRYADDLAFSGDRPFRRIIKRFLAHVSATVMEEGFAVNYRKTRIMAQGTRQRIVGLVVNEHPNVSRDEFDRLKAILTNCIRFGPQSQNHAQHADFRRHLDGRVAFVQMVNPGRGRRLRDLFDRIEW